MSKRFIFISPHLDDAVLSCGGLIDMISKNGQVEIWTIFNGTPLFARPSPLVKWLHKVCHVQNATELIQLRTQEDELAAHTVNAARRSFSYLDCAYRIDYLFRALYPHTCFTPLHIKDLGLMRSITKSLALYLKEDDTVFCPMAIGNHVDHILTREAVGSLNHTHLCYYEEVPYIMRSENRDSELFKNLCKIETQLHSTSIDRWWEAVCHYKSQISMVDPDGTSLFPYIEGFRTVPFRFFSKNQISNSILKEIDSSLPNRFDRIKRSRFSGGKKRR